MFLFGKKSCIEPLTVRDVLVAKISHKDPPGEIQQSLPQLLPQLLKKYSLPDFLSTYQDVNQFLGKDMRQLRERHGVDYRRWQRELLIRGGVCQQFQRQVTALKKNKQPLLLKEIQRFKETQLKSEQLALQVRNFRRSLALLQTYFYRRIDSIVKLTISKRNIESTLAAIDRVCRDKLTLALLKQPTDKVQQAPRLISDIEAALPNLLQMEQAQPNVLRSRMIGLLRLKKVKISEQVAASLKTSLRKLPHNFGALLKTYFSLKNQSYDPLRDIPFLIQQLLNNQKNSSPTQTRNQAEALIDNWQLINRWFLANKNNQSSFSQQFSALGNDFIQLRPLLWKKIQNRCLVFIKKIKEGNLQELLDSAVLFSSLVEKGRLFNKNCENILQSRLKGAFSTQLQQFKKGQAQLFDQWNGEDLDYCCIQCDLSQSYQSLKLLGIQSQADSGLDLQFLVNKGLIEGSLHDHLKMAQLFPLNRLGLCESWVWIAKRSIARSIMHFNRRSLPTRAQQIQLPRRFDRQRDLEKLIESIQSARNRVLFSRKFPALFELFKNYDPQSPLKSTAFINDFLTNCQTSIELAKSVFKESSSHEALKQVIQLCQEAVQMQIQCKAQQQIKKSMEREKIIYSNGKRIGSFKLDVRPSLVWKQTFIEEIKLFFARQEKGGEANRNAMRVDAFELIKFAPQFASRLTQVLELWFQKDGQQILKRFQSWGLKYSVREWLSVLTLGFTGDKLFSGSRKELQSRAIQKYCQLLHKQLDRLV